MLIVRGGRGMPMDSLFLHIFFMPINDEHSFSAEFLANGMANAFCTFPKGIFLVCCANFIKSPSGQEKEISKKHQNARNSCILYDQINVVTITVYMGHTECQRETMLGIEAADLAQKWCQKNSNQ